MSLRGAFVPGAARQGRCATKQSPRHFGIASQIALAMTDAIVIRCCAALSLMCAANVR
jgi:hypothetical protein